jgi:hypothetical protein
MMTIGTLGLFFIIRMALPIGVLLTLGTLLERRRTTTL